MQTRDLMSADGIKEAFKVELGHDVDGVQHPEGHEDRIQLAIGVIEREKANPSFLWSIARLQIRRTGISHEIYLFDIRNKVCMRHTHALGQPSGSRAVVDGSNSLDGFPWSQLRPLPIVCLLRSSQYRSPV